MLIIINQSNKLNQHIEKILYVAKTESKQIVLDKTKVDLKVLFELVKENIVLKHQKEIKIEVQLERDYIIQADEFHFYNVLYNIMDNAVKYSGLNPIIQIQSKENERGLLLKFSDNGVEKDAIAILKDHGFNYIRLRIFHSPALDSGYSPGKGFCDLEHTLQMAKRVKAAGMKLLLDFHYSDYWADPGKQYKPNAWKGLNFSQLKDSVEVYSRKVIKALKDQGTTPDMVQIGNEINHGMIWPDGHIGNLNNLAQLIQAGIDGVLSVDPSIAIMLHIALGGQHDETVFFYDNMLARGLTFDVIGMSYYPKWHGTLDDLRDNLIRMSSRYDQDIIVVEYSAKKREVHEIVFNLPNNKGKGTAIWEPLNTWESIFGKDGKSNDLILIYDEMNKKFIQKK